MTKEDIEDKVVAALPYVAVFGIAALAVYGVTKIVKAANDADFPLDFGDDPHLSSMFGSKNDD